MEDHSKRNSMDEALKSEKAFIDFVMSIPPENLQTFQKPVESTKGRNKNASPGNISTKVGLDHLDNLCKLMEQLSELRDTNCKLHRRVQYLEDLKSLHEMHKEIDDDGEHSILGSVPHKPSGYPLQKSATESQCSQQYEDTRYLFPTRSPSKNLSRRHKHQQPGNLRRERSKSVGHEVREDNKPKSIFPKWIKFKEAFRWESERKKPARLKPESGTRRRSDEAHQTYRTPSSPIWYQTNPLLQSSTEEIAEEFDEDRCKRASMISDKDVMFLDSSTDQLKSSPRTGSDKRSYHRNSDTKHKQYVLDREHCGKQDFNKFDRAEGKRGKSPWGKVKNIIERRRDSLKRKSMRRDQSESDLDKHDNLDSRIYFEYPECPARQKSCKSRSIDLDQEVEFRTPSSSPTFHRKSTWNKVKKVLKGKKDEERDSLSLSTPTSANENKDGNFTFDVIKEVPYDSNGDKPEISRVASDSRVHQLILTSHSSDIVQQLQSNLSEDFHRKIQEWENIRGKTAHSPSWDHKQSTDALRNRKKSDRDDKSAKTKMKDLTWLEKELQKIEKEKQRLSKERQKYEERGLRLEKLKETVLGGKYANKREVFIRTSAGEFRFEGISEDFTKKLYEWETKRGLGPELSTIALLDSSRLTGQISLGGKPGSLLLSRSESSIADIGQPSHNSSNSLPSSKLAVEAEDMERHPSRANSEPDLAMLSAMAKHNVSLIASVQTPTDSTDDKEKSNAARDIENKYDERRKGSETYYNILEENVILLEQLKDKDDICKRLENELEIMDDKVAVMNAHHMQEIERYKEKLWEIHNQKVAPRACLHAMSQLKGRIEDLERCTEKLKSDRECIEDSYRYHSKQQQDMTIGLLEKMKELQRSKSFVSDHEAEMNSKSIERLQSLSALLLRQTRDLENSLSDKSRQICKLKWQLLRKELSTVKLQTELHRDNAHRRRSKYSHWRSRSSEDAAASASLQKIESSFSGTVPDLYGTSSNDDVKASHLANTAHQLSREVLNLSSTDCQQSENRHWITKKHSTNCCAQVSKGTVENASMNNSLDKWVAETSSDHSEESSDEYYSKVSWKPTLRVNIPLERLLMSNGEHSPRGYLQKKKKNSRTFRTCSNLRRRSNTFHTNRDFEKINASEHSAPKCHSFRVVRDKDDEFLTNNINYETMCPDLALKPQEKFNIEPEKQTLEKVSKLQRFRKTQSLENENYTQFRDESELANLNLPIIYKDVDIINNNRPGVERSTSDRHKKDAALDKKDYSQKKRMKKRLKSPETLNLTSIDHDELHSDPFNRSKIYNTKISENENQLGTIGNINVEVPTITVQLPKKKQKKSTRKTEEFSNKEETFTIIVPKKRSFSSEHETSSISENSPREIEKLYSDRRNMDSSDSSTPMCSSKEILVDRPSDKIDVNSNLKGRRKVEITKLASFENFSGSVEKEEKNEPELIAKQHKFVSKHNRDSFQKEKQRDLPAKQNNKIKHHMNDLNKSHTAELRHDLSESNSKTHYVKSPSAPHIDWRRGCAKKVMNSGAPNVRNLIERYNQKVMESHTYKSPHSSNFNSPLTQRKISTPIQSCSSSYIPQYLSTPNTPTSKSPFFISPSASPMSLTRQEALQKAKENFISSQSLKSPTPSLKLPLKQSEPDVSTPLDDDAVSNASSDLMKLVILRAGESCKESRSPKHSRERTKLDPIPADPAELSTAKSLSSSSLFKSMLGSDFKMPTSFLRLKRSKRKKDMTAVNELCRQSLLLAGEPTAASSTPVSYKSCPSSPELKSKTLKSSWFHRNLFRHK